MTTQESKHETKERYNIQVVLVLASVVAIAAGSGIIVFANRAPRLEIVEPEQSLVTDDNTPIEVTFVLKNLGRKALLVHNVIPSQTCCGKTLDKPEQIAPRGEATLRVQVEPARVGKREFVFTLRTNDPLQEDALLKITTVPSKAPPFFVFEPASIQLFNVWKSGRCRDLLFETVEKAGQEPWLESITCDSQLIVVERTGEPETKSEFDHSIRRVYRYGIVLRELPPPGTVQSNLTIKTRDSEKIAKLTIQVVSPVRIVPTVLFVSPGGAEHRVELIARDSGTPVVARINSRPDWLEIREDASQTPGVQRFLVRVLLAPGADSADGTLVFQTDAPAAGELELRVCVRPEGDSPQ